MTNAHNNHAFKKRKHKQVDKVTKKFKTIQILSIVSQRTKKLFSVYGEEEM